MYVIHEPSRLITRCVRHGHSLSSAAKAVLAMGCKGLIAIKMILPFCN